MIPRVQWADARFDGAASPFLRGKTERPIRITFHTSSFTGATQDEIQAIDLLRELANLPEIEAMDTMTGSLPHLEIGVYEDDASSIPVTVTSSDQKTRSAIQAPGSWLATAAKLANQADKGNPNVHAVFQDILVARANHHLRYDLLITLSPHLLENREKPYLRSVNPRDPIEAAKIIGLLLRSRSNYVYQAAPTFRQSFNRGLFYWVLVRHKLPSMWRYFSACVHAEASRQDDILYLGQSILVRCTRALEARDAIGTQFYTPQNNDTRDIITAISLKFPT